MPIEKQSGLVFLQEDSMANNADKYVFAATLTYEPDQISITFPDLPGCTSNAYSEEEAISCAREALGGHLAVMEDFGEEIPTPHPLNGIQLAENEHSILVDVYMPLYREALETKAVSKTLTLPRWMARMAEDRGIKLSAVLQEALRDRLQMTKP